MFLITKVQSGSRLATLFRCERLLFSALPLLAVEFSVEDVGGLVGAGDGGGGGVGFGFCGVRAGVLGADAAGAEELLAAMLAHEPGAGLAAGAG